MTTIITEVPVPPRLADDPEARDRERQRLEGEFQRLVKPFLEGLRRAGLADTSGSGRIDVLFQEKDSGRLLVVEAKTSPGRVEPEDCRDLAGTEAPASLPADEAERQYQALGRWKGAPGTDDVQRAAREYWNRSGAGGARWLVARLRTETHEERLHWGAAILVELGSSSLGPILEALREDAPPDQALSLLRALGWMGERQTVDDSLVELVLVKHLLHEDPDVREAASRAFRVLPRGRARTWLARRLRDETDGEVRRTIEEELELVHDSHG